MTRLKEIRESKGISQKDFAAIIGVPANTYNQWENGKRQPDSEIMILIADYYGVTMDYLMGRKSPPTSSNISKPRGIRIPVYGYVAAGIPIEAIDNFDSSDPDDWEEIDEHMARGGEYFALRIKGDSMQPRMVEGDVVIVRRQPDVETGDIAIVCVNGDEATCKKIKKTPEGIMLISLNQAYEPMFYSNKQIEELPLTILGLVVELRAKF